jgi:hypothetical protein
MLKEAPKETFDARAKDRFWHRWHYPRTCHWAASLLRRSHQITSVGMHCDEECDGLLACAPIILMLAKHIDCDQPKPCAELGKSESCNFGPVVVVAAA